MNTQFIFNATTNTFKFVTLPESNNISEKLPANIYGNLIHNIQALNSHLTDLDNIVLIVNHTIPDFVLDFFEQKFKDSTKIIQVYDANSLATTFLEYGLSLNTLFPAVTYSQFRKPFLPEIYKALGHQSNDDK